MRAYWSFPHQLRLLEPGHIGRTSAANPNILGHCLQVDAPSMISILTSITQYHAGLIMFLAALLARLMLVYQRREGELRLRTRVTLQLHYYHSLSTRLFVCKIKEGDQKYT